MAEEGEARFTFDTKPFMDGLKNIGDGFNKTFSAAKKVGGAIVNALATPFQKAAFAAQKAMPIVGQTFDFVKDVISRNLFAPLQRELLPLLQKLIKWVTENRPLFVKWGQVIANVFRGVWEAAKKVWEVVQAIFDMITKALSKNFGGAFRDIDEVINTIVWKAVMLLLFLTESFKNAQAKFEPLITAIVGFVARAGGQFVELGLKMFDAWSKGNNFEKLVRGVEGVLKGIEAVITPVVTGIGNLVTQLLLPDDNEKTFGDVLESLGGLAAVVGELVGSSTDAFFETFNVTVRNISSTLDGIITKFTELANIIKESGIVQKAFKSLGSLLGNAIMIILVGVQTTMNNLVSTFKTIGVLGGEGSWAEKWDKMKDIDKERREYTDAAWGNVEWVRQLRAWDDNASANADRSRQQSNTTQTAQATMQNAQAGLFENISPVDLAQAEQIFGMATNRMNLGNEHEPAKAELISAAARDYGNYGGSFIDRFKEVINKKYEGTSGYSAVNDAIITKDGQVIRTAPDDNIYAFKALGGAKPAQAQPPTIHFGDVYITVPEGSSPAYAEALGRSAASGFAASLAQELSASLLREST
jgi:hypothetical protein